MRPLRSGFALVCFALLCALCEQSFAADAVASLNLTSPSDYQVFQRATRLKGIVVVSGSVASGAKGDVPVEVLEARLLGKPLEGELAGVWQRLPFDPRVAAFRAELPAPAGGWYRFEIRARRSGTNVAEMAVERVGVGEVFVVAGQSNSANHGEKRQESKTGMAGAFNGVRWQMANDPQPGASGNGGSFMPAFADTMHGRFKVPIGIVATGIGATSVREWLPRGVRFPNPPTLTGRVVTVGQGEWESNGSIFSGFTSRIKELGPRGFRAVLWHQGESDANQRDADRTLTGELYRRYMEQLIRGARREAGWDCPWFVALASYHSPDDTGSPDIRSAQRALWKSGLALEGFDSDALAGDHRDGGGRGVHFSEKGLKAHGKAWEERVGTWLERVLASGQ